MAPLTTAVLLTLAFIVIIGVYQNRHNGRIFTGVNVAGVDLSQLTMEDAEHELAAQLSTAQLVPMVLTDPTTNQEWTFSSAELGLRVDFSATVEAAYQIGREDEPQINRREMWQSYYYGRSVPPVIVLDEGQLNETLYAVTEAINQPPVNAALLINETDVEYAAGEPGRLLDQADLRSRLTNQLVNFQPATIELLVHEVAPVVVDSTAASTGIQHTYSNPLTFYLQEPLDDIDLGLSQVELSSQQLANWLRVEVLEGSEGQLQHDVSIDRNALRNWLSQFLDQLYREPLNARFYFDDTTRELVLVAPQVNGRELDIEATIDQLATQIDTPNRSVPFIVNDIVPTVHQNATAVELGITELITQTTTWFYGSTDARKHNIARAAANFYGIVIAPGEEFSFNKYIGTISEADGFTQGFVIIDGQAVAGIGGGVCQVSTTVYQTAFNAGFPITERWPHGYMLNYYNDGEGPGMDATIYTPLVDIKFINNTPYHLLIENYYNEENEALTFKFYSTSLGRQIEKEMLPWENVTEIPSSDEDKWEFDPELEPGTVEQIDWATEGADVTVHRLIYNADGDVIGDQLFASHYLPVPNLYHYGPDVEPYSYWLVPDDE